MEVVKERDLEELGMDFQYIAFSFCNEKELLKKEISSQIDRILES